VTAADVERDAAAVLDDLDARIAEIDAVRER
jgi:hypothetical protein